MVRHGSFEAAAGALSVTPSAVSQRIKALEHAAGQVLVRRARPTAATAAGAVLLRLAGQVALLESAARTALGSAGPVTLALAVNADSLSTWFDEVLADLPRGALVDVHRADQDLTSGLLRDGTVMAAVTGDAAAVQGCSCTPLGAMRYLAVATAEYRDTYLGGHLPGASTQTQWASAPLAAFDRSDTLQDQFLASLGVSAQPPRNYLPTQESFLRVVRAGRAWGMAAESAVADDLAAGALVDAAPGRWLDLPLFWQRWKVDAPVLADLTVRVRAAAGRRLRPTGRT
ncbi:MAG TPA: ArgP/LysG family DNA-binding transcriptional regulator [Actinotalea sp.]|nr:ArgP/LysG family DNA-binding transcriptional regulator [Actinotalea sp.]